MVKKHALYTAYGDSVSDALCEDTMVDPFFDSESLSIIINELSKAVYLCKTCGDEMVYNRGFTHKATGEVECGLNISGGLHLEL